MDFLESEIPVILAPMAGVTDLPFRKIVSKISSPSLIFCEMLASEAMLRCAQKSLRRIASDSQTPLAVQLLGNNPNVMSDAAKICEQNGAKIIDINMGCPAKKIALNSEAGAALMKDETLAGKIIESVATSVKIPVTVKMRKGWDEAAQNAPKLAEIAESSGAKLITIHSRTRAQFYGGAADWPFIKVVKSSVLLPVIANGDIRCEWTASEILRISEAKGIMIGRACLGKPWLIGQILHFLKTGSLKPSPSIQDQLLIIEEHFEENLSHYGIEQGVRTFRKHLSWYSKRLPHSSEFRDNMLKKSSPEEITNGIRHFYETISKVI
ncbi:tRNA dihydrouridine synthase DusB [Candidatus Hydrogenosomobacter endosymbioticus]|uniref:tRNA-dihydrouridine synthase n=1 Tax=Candidatus Hydrogenosomobacter endosymbioticus TaxID=2558174 RepID=A0ABM7V9G0_9PROT|nr:tRNA dihydrouridine synthase DusB [Candidatus Hydrogenosomobacter endosymbioticus]BDB96422.1 putative tRNA-dihydrouridine synthase [Candidatus Hydrogenosomobacter endosymbioticus]